MKKQIFKNQLNITPLIVIALFIFQTAFSQTECVPQTISVNVGNDIILCGENSTTISVETNGTGKWVKTSFGTGDITNPTSKTTTVTNLDYMTNNVFQWQSDVNACDVLNIIDKTITVVARQNPDLLLTSSKLDCSTAEISISTRGLSYTYYNWTTTDGNIVSGQGTKSIVVDKNGTYQVKAIPNITGIITYICPVIQSIQVTNISNPIKAIIAQPQALSCVFNAVDLNGSASTRGANIVYEWSTKDGIISSGKNSAIATTYLPGTYDLKVTDITTNCSETSSVVVIALPINPVANISKLENLSCSKNKVILDGSTSTSGDNIIYEWGTVGGEILSGQGTNKIEVSKVGTYSLSVIDKETSCASFTSISVISDCDLSSPEFEFSSQFDLLPNPANEVVAVSSKNNQKIQSVQIYNLIGQLVLQTSVVDSEINISALSKGTYLLNVLSNKDNFTTKLVKN